MATQEEVGATRARAIEGKDGHYIPDGNEGDARLFRMIEDIHKLAVSPHVESPRDYNPKLDLQVTKGTTS